MADKSESLQSCYRKITGRFGDAGGFYDPDLGHGGTDYASGSGEAVLAYADGVIGYKGSSGWGGGVVGMKMDAGDYAGWAHLDPVIVRVDQRVKAGDVIGYTAGWSGDHGTSWTGPHIHTTRSAQSSMAAALGYRPLIDPAPGIASALTIQGEEMTPEQDSMLRSVFRAIYEIPIENFGRRPSGIGREILRIRDSQFKDSETSFGTPGGTLATLKVVLDQQALIMKHLGIEPDTDA